MFAKSAKDSTRHPIKKVPKYTPPIAISKENTKDSASMNCSFLLLLAWFMNCALFVSICIFYL